MTQVCSWFSRAVASIKACQPILFEQPNVAFWALFFQRLGGNCNFGRLNQRYPDPIFIRYVVALQQMMVLKNKIMQHDQYGKKDFNILLTLQDQTVLKVYYQIRTATRNAPVRRVSAKTNQVVPYNNSSEMAVHVTFAVPPDLLLPALQANAKKASSMKEAIKSVAELILSWIEAASYSVHHKHGILRLNINTSFVNLVYRAFVQYGLLTQTDVLHANGICHLIGYHMFGHYFWFDDGDLEIDRLITEFGTEADFPSPNVFALNKRFQKISDWQDIKKEVAVNAFADSAEDVLKALSQCYLWKNSHLATISNLLCGGLFHDPLAQIFKCLNHQGLLKKMSNISYAIAVDFDGTLPVLCDFFDKLMMAMLNTPLADLQKKLKLFLKKRSAKAKKIVAAMDCLLPYVHSLQGCYTTIGLFGFLQFMFAKPRKKLFILPITQRNAYTGNICRVGPTSISIRQFISACGDYVYLDSFSPKVSVLATVGESCPQASLVLCDDSYFELLQLKNKLTSILVQQKNNAILSLSFFLQLGECFPNQLLDKTSQIHNIQGRDSVDSASRTLQRRPGSRSAFFQSAQAATVRVKRSQVVSGVA